MKKAAAILALLALLGALGVAVFWHRTDDPEYVLSETLALGGYDRYNDLILQASQRYGVPPELIKAVIWRESRFRPDKIGSQGERGLMQIMEPAAEDWAKAEKMETFVPTDLLDPKVNIEAGTWYLSRALAHWKDKVDPVSFALAEYNAGRGRVKRWVKDSGQGDTAQAEDLQTAMDFPGTKSYVAVIRSRADYYKAHQEFTPALPGPTP